MKKQISEKEYNNMYCEKYLENNQNNLSYLIIINYY
jgi:hypothetical protein